MELKWDTTLTDEDPGPHLYQRAEHADKLRQKAVQQPVTQLPAGPAAAAPPIAAPWTADTGNRPAWEYAQVTKADWDAVAARLISIGYPGFNQKGGEPARREMNRILYTFWDTARHLPGYVDQLLDPALDVARINNLADAAFDETLAGIAARAAEGGTNVEADLDRFLQAVATIHIEAAERYRYPAQIQYDRNTQGGQLDYWQQPNREYKIETLLQRVAEEHPSEEITQYLAAIGDTTATAEQIAEMQQAAMESTFGGLESETLKNLKQLLDQPAGWWHNPDSNMLTVSTENEHVLIELDEGTRIDHDGDVVYEWLVAQYGYGHRIVAEETLPHDSLLKQLGDKLYESFPWVPAAFRAANDATSDALDRAAMYLVKGETYDEKLETALDNITEAEQGRRDLVSSAPVALARIWQAVTQAPTAPAVYGIRDAAQLIEAMTPEEIQAVTLSEDNLSIDQFRAIIEEDLTSKLWLAEPLSQVVDAGLEVARVWENLVQDLGITALHFSTPNIVATALGNPLFGPEPEAAPEGFIDGARAFLESWQTAMSDETVSEYLGIEDSGFAGWLNVGTSIFVDPVTWITLGGGGSMKQALTMLTRSPESAAAYVRRNQLFRSAANQIVKSPNGARVAVQIGQNMGDPALFRRLLAIGRRDFTQPDTALVGPVLKPKDRISRAVDEVMDIFTAAQPGNGGAWIPQAPGTLARRNRLSSWVDAVEGWANYDVSQRGALARTGSIFFGQPNQTAAVRLGDNFFLQEADEIAWTLHKLGIQNYDEAIDEIIDLFLFDRDNALTIRELTETRIKQKKAELAVASSNLAADFPTLKHPALGRYDPSRMGRLRSQRFQTQKQIDKIDTQLGLKTEKPITDTRSLIDALKDQGSYDQLLVAKREMLERQLSDIDELLATVTDRVRAYEDLELALTRDIETLKKVGITEAGDRRALEMWVHDKYWQIGDKLELPLLNEAHPLLTNRQIHDWSQVAGRSWTPQKYAAFSQNAKPLANFSDDVRKFGEAVGITQNFTVTQVPASLYEVLAYWASPQTLRDLRGFMRQPNRINQIRSALQTSWVIAVLGNPVTAFKSHLDEVIRFAEATGNWKDAAVAAAKFFYGKRNAPGSGRGAQFVRDFSNYRASLNQGWELLQPGSKWHPAAVERWVNGFLANNDVVQAYARANGDKAVFLEWFERQGKANARRTYYTIDGVSHPVNGASTWQGMTTFFDELARNAKTPQAGKRIVEEVLDAIRNGTEWKNWELIRAFPAVPGQSFQRTGATGGLAAKGHQAMEALYGRPGEIRSGMIYDHYEKWAQNYYRAAAASPNSRFRILTADDVIATAKKHGVKLTETEARHILDAGARNEFVRELLRTSGTYTPRMLDDMASVFARQNAEHMMYNIAVMSPFGKLTRPIYPFGKAQYEFWRYWLGRMFDPTHFRSVGNLPITTPVAGGASLDLRLVDRVLKLPEHIRFDPDDDEDQAGLTDPEFWYRQFTFLPNWWDAQEFLLELAPSLGPLPLWAILMFNPEGEGFTGKTRDVFESIHPAVRHWYEDTHTFDNALTELIQLGAPLRGRSVYRMMYDALGWIPPGLGGKEVRKVITGLLNAMRYDTDPYGLRPRQEEELAGLLRRAGLNTPVAVKVGDGYDPNNQFTKDVQAGLKKALEASYFEQAQIGIGKLTGDLISNDPVGQYVEGWKTVQYVPWDYVIAEGWVDEQLRSDYMTRLADLSETSTPEQKADFADSASDIFWKLPRWMRGMLLTYDQALALAMVSWSQIPDIELVPAEFQQYVSGDGLIPTLEDRTTIARKGWQQGWIQQRDREEVGHVAHAVVNRDVRHFLMSVVDDALEFKRNSVPNMANDEYIRFDTTDFRWEPFKVAMGPYGEWMDGDPERRRGAGRPGAWSMVGDWVEIPVDAFEQWLDERKDVLKTPFSTFGDIYTYLDTPQQRRAMAVYEAVIEAYNDQHWVADTSMRDWGYEPFVYDPNSQIHQEEPNLVKFHGQTGIEIRERMRRWASGLLDLQRSGITSLTPHEYNQFFGYHLGPADWEMPTFTLEDAETVIDVERRNLRVVDGDTLELTLTDGVMPIRLVGVATPEEGQNGYEAASGQLQRLVDLPGADIKLVQYRPELYGRTQEFLTEAGEVRERTFMILFVNGQPITQPGVFSATNPRGVHLGGVVTDWVKMLEGAK